MRTAVIASLATSLLLPAQALTDDQLTLNCRIENRLDLRTGKDLSHLLPQSFSATVLIIPGPLCSEMPSDGAIIFFFVR
jgi:hypothetical protein